MNLCAGFAKVLQSGDVVLVDFDGMLHESSGDLSVTVCCGRDASGMRKGPPVTGWTTGAPIATGMSEADLAVRFGAREEKTTTIAHAFAHGATAPVVKVEEKDIAIDKAHYGEIINPMGGAVGDAIRAWAKAFAWSCEPAETRARSTRGAEPAEGLAQTMLAQAMPTMEALASALAKAAAFSAEARAGRRRFTITSSPAFGEIVMGSCPWCARDGRYDFMRDRCGATLNTFDGRRVCAECEHVIDGKTTPCPVPRCEHAMEPRWTQRDGIVQGCPVHGPGACEEE